MRFYSLGSGSSGNAFLLVNDQVSLLIDCGVAVRHCKDALRQLSASHSLAGIIVSHEHSDHVRAIPSVLRDSPDCPLVTTAGTYSAIRSPARWSQRTTGQRFSDGSIEVTFVEVSHDAAEPCGFIVEASGTRFAVFTDLGVVTDSVLDAARTADVIIFESNYDAGMLRFGAYPAHLKRRIQGPRGHLSNDDCATALAAAVTSRTRAIWLAHLSHNNNRPDLALSSTEEALRLAGHSVPVAVLPRFETVEIIAHRVQQIPLGF